MNEDFLVSCVVNFHREPAEYLDQCLKSLVANLENSGYPANLFEILVVLDNSPPGLEPLFSLNLENYRFKILRFNYGELSASRNQAVSIAKGKYVAFLDGDDIWGLSWIREALQTAQELDESSSEMHIFHSAQNIFFTHLSTGASFEVRNQLNHFDYAEHVFALAYGNFWTSLSFGLREIYISFPFVETNLKIGHGFEDWTFNIATLAAGARHLVVPNTHHLIRVKSSSMRLSGKHQNLLFSHASFFLSNHLAL